MNKTVRHLFKENSMVIFEDRSENNGQKPIIFWFTGLSGTRKSTIPSEFERLLFGRGRIDFCLDADDLKNKLNSCFGFSMEDRVENVRRAAETARLLQDADVIVQATFISLTRAFHDQACSIAHRNVS